MSRRTPDTTAGLLVSCTRLSLPSARFPNRFHYHSLHCFLWSTTPQCMHRGLACCPFARRYSGNRCFFLFLPLLRCFSSRRSPCMTMDSSYSDRAFLGRVPPFGYLRIIDYVRLPEAFRSFLRPSSVLDAKAFTLCSY